MKTFNPSLVYAHFNDNIYAEMNLQFSFFSEEETGLKIPQYIYSL